MHDVSMLDFRRDPKAVIRRVENGEELTLTYRGRPVIRLAPVMDQSKPRDDDPMYRLADHAVDRIDPMTDRDIDRIVYDL